MGSVAVTRSCLEIESSTQTVLPVELGGHEVAFDARAYQGKDENAQALALLSPSCGGDHAGGDARGRGVVATVRLHSGCVTGDIFHSLRCDCYQQLQAALAEVVAAPCGVLIYLPYQEGRGIGLVNKIRAYANRTRGSIRSMRTSKSASRSTRVIMDFPLRFWLISAYRRFACLRTTRQKSKLCARKALTLSSKSRCVPSRARTTKPTSIPSANVWITRSRPVCSKLAARLAAFRKDYGVLRVPLWSFVKISTWPLRRPRSKIRPL